jgi:SAM-dependent methyltransferase
MSAEDRVDRLLRLHWRSNHWKIRFLRQVDAAFVGFWLGVLDRDALVRLDEELYRTRREPLRDGGGDTAAYTDAAWTRSGLFDWERESVERFFPEGGRVVVTGAGGGREVLALRGMGFDATGFEPNAALVEAGRAVLAEDGHEGRLDLLERDAFPPGQSGLDGVVVGWGSYHFIAGRERRAAFLRDVHAALRPGGVVLLSFFTRADGDPQAATITRVANAVRAVRRGERLELGDDLRPQFAHRFTVDEIRTELQACGFEVLHDAREPYGHAVARAV